MNDRTVFVVMGNDFPDSVFGQVEMAEQYVAEKIQEERDKTRDFRRIHWRYYEFDIQG